MNIKSFLVQNHILLTGYNIHLYENEYVKRVSNILLGFIDRL